MKRNSPVEAIDTVNFAANSAACISCMRCMKQCPKNARNVNGMMVSAAALYPNAAEKLCQRASRYNEGVALAQEYAEQGKVLIVAPDDTCGVSTLSRDPTDMQSLYEKGYADGKKVKSFMHSNL